LKQLPSRQLEFPSEQASAFKIPHHGSVTARRADTWTRLGLTLPTAGSDRSPWTYRFIAPSARASKSMIDLKLDGEISDIHIPNSEQKKLRAARVGYYERRDRWSVHDRLVRGARRSSSSRQQWIGR
jgi:hypothetical protein